MSADLGSLPFIGIKTDIQIVERYVEELFEKVIDQDEDFLENLSTPLYRDPQDILKHLQNASLTAGVFGT
jgi:hypothetical protein